jgi:hypothetical protein
MWDKAPNKVGHKYLMQGSAGVADLPDIMSASEFAARCGLTTKDNQYNYTTFCIKFTTGELLKAMNTMEGQPDAPA